MRRSCLSKFGLLIGGFACGLLMVESSFRLFYPQSPIQSTQTLLNRGRFKTPGIHHNVTSEFNVTVTVNSYGFVDHSWDLEHTDILLIGDSFVQGAQVSMSAAVGRKLGHDMTKNIKSIGVPGAGTSTELLLLKEWIAQLRPRIVMVAFLPSNDILNNHPHLESKTDKPFVNLDTFRTKQELVVEFNKPTVQSHRALHYSHTLRWFWRSAYKHEVAQQKIQQGNGVPIDWHVYNPARDAVWEEAWNITTELYAEIASVCKAGDTELKVVLFPSIEEISQSHQKMITRSYPEMKNWAIVDGLERQSLEMLSKAGIPAKNILSLYPVFRAHPAPDTLYFKRDHHWTETGHALASEAIQTWLQQEQ